MVLNKLMTEVDSQQRASQSPVCLVSTVLCMVCTAGPVSVTQLEGQPHCRCAALAVLPTELSEA